jgi:hypothetical protein
VFLFKTPITTPRHFYEPLRIRKKTYFLRGAAVASGTFKINFKKIHNFSLDFD